MSLRDRAWFPVSYMFVLTLVLSTILIIFGTATRKRVEENETLAFERAVLEALSIELGAASAPGQIHRIYLSDIRAADETSASALMYIKGDSLHGYALPLEGPGFWAPIKGVIGIAPDRVTITGIAFYEQNETPGLGGEITRPSFRTQFAGKRITDAGRPLEIRSPSEPLDESSVHAITGATQTSIRLEKFMNERLAGWRDAMEAVR
ncbi:FMN-binding protein [candidate division WOR-3 bacterium]|nr:FMN-binding protein [candidate division WOR-3 bacterium]